MELGRGWYTWWVSTDFIPKAMKQLEEAGCDMTLVKFVHDVTATPKFSTVLVYKGVPREVMAANHKLRKNGTIR